MWLEHGLNTGYTIVSSAATFKSSERLGRINSPFDSHEKEKTCQHTILTHHVLLGL